MDITCPRCGEAWDNDCIHDEVSERALLGQVTSYDAVAREFRARGCIALRAFTGNDSLCERVRDDRTAAAGALYDLLGDDMDGASAMLADLGY